jgi:hypothetical protein
MELVSCLCIRYRGNVSTEPLPSNNRENLIVPLPINDNGIFTEPLPSNDKGTFAGPLHCNGRGDTQTHTHTEQRDLISLLLFLQNKESRLIKKTGKNQHFMVFVLKTASKNKDGMEMRLCILTLITRDYVMQI